MGEEEEEEEGWQAGAGGAWPISLRDVAMSPLDQAGTVTRLYARPSSRDKTTPVAYVCMISHNISLVMAMQNRAITVGRSVQVARIVHRRDSFQAKVISYFISQRTLGWRLYTDSSCIERPLNKAEKLTYIAQAPSICSRPERVCTARHGIVYLPQPTAQYNVPPQHSMQTVKQESEWLALTYTLESC